MDEITFPCPHSNEGACRRCVELFTATVAQPHADRAEKYRRALQQIAKSQTLSYARSKAREALEGK